MEAVTFKKAVYISHMYCTGHRRFNIRLPATGKRNNRLEIMKTRIIQCCGYQAGLRCRFVSSGQS